MVKADAQDTALIAISERPEHRAVRLGRGRRTAFHGVVLGCRAVGMIVPLRHVGAARCRNAVDDAQILEDLQGKRLETLAAGAAKRLVHFLDQPERDAAPGKMARDRLGRAIFASWEAEDIDDLVRLMRKFADAVKDGPT